MNSYIKLAKDTISVFVRNGKVLGLPKDLPEEMLENRAGVFVSIHTKRGLTRNEGSQINAEGELRGCIGTFLSSKSCIAQEIIDNAISACSRDYRFEPVNSEELDNLEVSVDVLNEPELISNNLITNNSFLISKLDARKYGVIVKSTDGRVGVLLPDLPGVNTPQEQIAICRQKAGISPDEPIDIYRFEVTRYKE